MKPDRAEHRLAELQAAVREYNNKYYQQHVSEISDREYDALLSELQELEQELHIPEEDRISNMIGSDHHKGFRTVQHTRPMLSMMNTYTIQELQLKLKRLSGMMSDTSSLFTVEPKVDGIAISLHYVHGKLALAVTRGDGVSGDEVTQNIATIKSIPKVLAEDLTVEVRGEAYIQREEFIRLNQLREQSGEPLFANARNLCAGTVKLLDLKEVKARPLDFVAYTLFDDTLQTHVEEVERLRSLGFPTIEILSCDSITPTLHTVQQFSNKKHNFPFETDGTVIQINNKQDCLHLGATSKAPRWRVAFKYEPDHARTRVISIDDTVGRTGAITPTAIVEPTTLSGSVVSRVNLYNYPLAHQRDIRIGDVVSIHKSAEIIPEIINVHKECRKGTEIIIPIPEKCPECAGIVMLEGVSLKCMNAKCRAKQLESIVYFAAKPCMSIMDLGPMRIKLLLDTKSISSVVDLYTLTDHQLMKIGFGEKQAMGIIRSINKSRSQPAEKVLAALGIRFVGTVVSVDLLKAFGSILKLMEVTERQIMEVPGMGSVIAHAVVEFFKQPDNREMVLQLHSFGLHMEYVQKDVATYAKCAITGRTDGVSKSKLAEILLKHNVVVTDSVDTTTSFLLTGDECDTASKKYLKAQQLGIPIYPTSRYLTC